MAERISTIKAETGFRQDYNQVPGRLICSWPLTGLTQGCSQGTQTTRLGSNVESRFWLSYRPYESKDVRREWFIGPTLTWLHSSQNRIEDVEQDGSGGDVLMAGVTTYVGLRPGMHVWVAADWDAVHSTGVAFMPVRRHFSFGVTQQFRIHL